MLVLQPFSVIQAPHSYKHNKLARTKFCKVTEGMSEKYAQMNFGEPFYTYLHLLWLTHYALLTMLPERHITMNFNLQVSTICSLNTVPHLIFLFNTSLSQCQNPEKFSLLSKINLLGSK